ncbi:MAG TPA: hypothetical protein VN721_11065 [Flavipsychrobacter sp.]|nr:hypothetical protein [Flavipsychrobacter sp.]
MIKTLSFLILIIASFSSAAQQKIKLRPLWHEPQVHIIFGNYDIYYTIKDINEAMKLLPNSDRALWGDSCGLDTNATYNIELLARRGNEYKNKLQPLLQEEVGAFLLLKGHALVQTHKHKNLRTLIANVGPIMDMGNGKSTCGVTFYDPRNQEMVFSGDMSANMSNMDLDIEHK